MTYSYVYHDSPICVSWLIRIYIQSHQTAKISHAAYIIESWCTCEWVTAHIWGNYGICECVVSRINSVLRQLVCFLLPGECMVHVCNDTPIWTPWLTPMRMRCVTYKLCSAPTSRLSFASWMHVCKDSFICTLLLTHVCAMTYTHIHTESSNSKKLMDNLCHDSSRCVPWLIQMCAMTYLRVCHDLFIHVLWLFHMHTAFKCVTRLIHTCAMTHMHTHTEVLIWRNSMIIYASGDNDHIWKEPLDIGFFCWKWPLKIRMPRRIHICAMTYAYIRHAYICLWLIHTYMQKHHSKTKVNASHRIVVETRKICACYMNLQIHTNFSSLFTSIDESYSNVATKLRTHSHYMHIKPNTEASVDVV